MLRRIGWTWPLLLGALVCLTGCTFPKSFGFARKQHSQTETQVADDRADATPGDMAAEEPKPSLAQSLRKSTGWFSFGRQKRADAEQQPLLNNIEAQATTSGDAPAIASQPLTYPHVVPSKYRNMSPAVPDGSLAKDTVGTPSLVRPSRRPPPDPAPKPPLDTPPQAQLVEKPRAEGPVYDFIAAASQSWRVPPRPTAAPGSRTPDKPAQAAAAAPPPQLATETKLKFTSPDLSARDRKTVTKPTDIVTNMLRPAKSAPTAAGTTLPTVAAQTGPARPTASNTRPAPETSWIAKNIVPSSAAPGASAPTGPAAPTGPPQTSETYGAAKDAAVSNVVANTFGGTVSNPKASAPSTPVAKRDAATEVVHNHPALPQPQSQPQTQPQPQPQTQTQPTGPPLSIPKRSDAVARAETTPRETLTPQPRVYLTKTPSHAQPTVPTRAAAPAEAVAEERLAPLVDADTYRARFASTPSTQPVPVHTAARASAQPVPGSWVAAYQRLVQQNGAPPAPRPPAGSPSRTLSSDDEPAIPEPSPPILRR